MVISIVFVIFIGNIFNLRRDNIFILLGMGFVGIKMVIFGLWVGWMM